MSDQTPHAAAERFLRFLLAAAMPVLMLAITLTTPDPAGDIKRLLLAWTATLVGVGWVGASWWFNLRMRRPPLFFFLLLSVLAVYAVATIPSEFPWGGILALSRRMGLFTLYLVASQLFLKEKHLRTFLFWSCMGMLCVSAYAFLQAADLDPIPWTEKNSDVYRNLPSTFGHPNFAAHALMFLIPYAFYLALTGDRWAWVLAAAFLVYLKATGQRAGWIALAGAGTLVVAGQFVGTRFKNVLTGAMATLGATALAGLAGLGAIVGWTVLRSGLAFPIDESILLRYSSYVSAARMFFDRPILGHGPGVYALKNPIYWTPFEQEWFAQERKMNGHVHNDLIETGIDAGVFASGLYLALLFAGVLFGLMMALRADTPQRRRLGFLFAAIFTAFGIDGLFGFSLYVPVSSALFFITMGMLDAQYLAVSGASPVQSRWARPLQCAIVVLLPIICIFESLLFSSQQDIQAGSSAQSAGKYEISERYFERALAKMPWDWNIYRQIGHSKAARNDFDGAIESYETLLKKNPYYLLTRLPLAHARMRRAQLFLKDHADQPAEALRQMDEGAADLEHALEVCPMLPEAHQLLGQISSASAVIVQRQDDAKAHDRARSYWLKAQSHLEEAIKYKLEDMGEIYRMLSQVRIALGDLPGAEHALTEAVRRDPHDTGMWPVFLDFVLKFKRFDQARNVLAAQIRELESEEPSKADQPKVTQAITTTKLFLANVLENGYADYDGALAAYRQAAALEPGRPEVWANFARFASQRNRMDEFKAAILQAVKQGGEKAGETLPGSVRSLEVYLREGVPGLYEASGILLAAARSYQQTEGGLDADGALGWALDYLLQTVQPLPVSEHCLVVFNLGLCLNALKEYERARGLLQLVDGCVPPDQAAAYALHYADTLAGLGQAEEALGVLEQGVNAYPQDLELRWALARNLGRLGRSDRAREIYDKLLSESGLAADGRSMLERERAALK